jgi:hypothetical protein
MRVPQFAVSTIVLIAAACSSGSAPAPRLRVTLTGPPTAQGFLTTQGANTVYRCDVSLSGTVTGGSSGDVGTWSGGYFRFTHADGSSDASSFPDPQRFFDGNATSFTVGTRLIGNDYFYSGTQRPFQVHLVLYYAAPHVTRDSAVYDLACH